MKRLTPILSAILLVLSLAACASGPDQPAPGFDLSLAGKLLDSGAFSEPLDRLDTDVMWVLYGLEDAGLTQAQLTACDCRRSSGATCEELSILQFATEDAAQTAMTALEHYLTGQISANVNYRPAEVPKLEGALLERRGACVLLMVANDRAAAQGLLAP